MRLRASCIALIGVILLTFGAPSVASADTASDVHVVMTLEADGVLHVEQSLTLADAPHEIRQTIPKTWPVDSSSFFRYEISDVVASVGGEPADVSTTETGAAVEVLVTAPEAGEEVRISYEVRGTTRTEQGEEGQLTVLQWPALTGLSLAVDSLTGVVAGPGGPQMMDCVAGPRDSVGKCALITGGTFDSPDPSFQDGPRAAGDNVVITVAYSADQVAATAEVDHRWSLDRAFEVSPWTALLALFAGLTGGLLLWSLYRRTGRDVAHSGDVAPIASFAPVGDGQSVFQVTDSVRPGHVGTVADERVDPVDITATLIDLAVRGHLRITELPHAMHELLDWRLERRLNDAPLVEFERVLLDTIVPAGRTTLVSELPATLAHGISDVQDALYDDVVARGWFESRPDSTRSSWRLRGYLALGAAMVVAGLLIAFTNLGLVALVLLAVGVATVRVSERMPRRTAAGTAMLRGLSALSALLATHPTTQMPRGQELGEISRLLGYTIVLGGKNRWLSALVAADDDDTADPEALDWYHAPDTWHLRDLPASLTQFIHVVQGELFDR